MGQLAQQAAPDGPRQGAELPCPVNGELEENQAEIMENKPGFFCSEVFLRDPYMCSTR